MEKNICNDNHKYGNFIDEKNMFTRICQCCGHKSSIPKDSTTEEEYKKQQEQYLIQLIRQLIERNINIIDSSESLITATRTLIDNLSYINISNEEIKTLIESLNNLNSVYNNEQSEKLLIIKKSIDFIDLFFKREKLEIKEGKDVLTEEENDKFYENWLNITYDFTPILNTIYDNKKNHLQSR